MLMLIIQAIGAYILFVVASASLGIWQKKRRQEGSAQNRISYIDGDGYQIKVTSRETRDGLVSVSKELSWTPRDGDRLTWTARAE